MIKESRNHSFGTYAKYSEKLTLVTCVYQGVKNMLVQKQPPEVFCKKKCSEKFAKFTGKYLCQSLVFNKIAGLRSATFLKKRLRHRCFCEISKNIFFIEHLWVTVSVSFLEHFAYVLNGWFQRQFCFLTFWRISCNVYNNSQSFPEKKLLDRYTKDCNS